MHTALATYKDHFHTQIFQRLPAQTIALLDTLLMSEEPADPDADVSDPASTRRALIHLLKADPGPMRVDTAHEEVAKLTRLRALHLPADLFSGIPSTVLQEYKQRLTAEEPHELRRHPPALRCTLLAAFCWIRLREVTDTLVDLLNAMIHHVGMQAERRVTKELLQHIKHVANKTGILRQLAEAAVNHPDGITKEVLFRVVDERTLRDLITELHPISLVQRQRVQTVMRRSYGSHYRRMVPPLLHVLEFRSNNAVHRPVIEALDLIKRYDGSTATYYDPNDLVPLDGVVPTAWHDVLFDRTRQGQRVHRVTYEICVLQALREKLRCKELWVIGADRHRNPEEDLPQDFAMHRDTYYATLKLPLDGDAFIQQLQHEHEAALAMLDQGLPRNPSVRILPKAGGWINLTPLAPQLEPPQLHALKHERWMMTSLLDMLKEADARVQLTEVFKSLTGREHLDRGTLQKRILLCLYGLGTNTGLKRMAAGNGDVTAKDLLYVRRRFISCDHLRNAIARVVNAIFLAVRLSAIWGDATMTCASDSKNLAPGIKTWLPSGMHAIPAPVWSFIGMWRRNQRVSTHSSRPVRPPRSPR
jgi:hypothetical protein